MGMNMVRIQIAALLLASTAGGMSAVIDGLPDRFVPWGATGIVAFVVYWLLARTVPGILRGQREMVDAHKDAIAKLADSVDRNSRAVDKCRWRNKEDN
jgi:hypothetical protein